MSTRPRLLTHAVMTATMLVIAASTMACGTEDIPPGNKGFLFDRTGGLALYTGGHGLESEVVLGPGTHYTGIYDEVKDVDCKDAHAREEVEVLTKSDLTVAVDLRLTYSADCSTKETLIKILDQVASGDDKTVEPTALYTRYILPIIRESLRNRLAAVSIEDVKAVRSEVRNGVREDLTKSIDDLQNPVIVKIFTISDIRLPEEIIEKNRQIELARQDAEQEREKQEAAKYRLERELFEAQQDRKVEVERAEKAREVEKINAERDKDVAILQAEADLERKKREAEGIAAVRKELTGPYLSYLQLLKDAEVRKDMAAALSNGTKWYVGPDFVVPPGSSANIAVKP